MRLKPLAPSSLSPEQRAVHDSVEAGVARFLHGFKAVEENGGLNGPFTSMVQFPKLGRPAWDFLVALAEHSTLPRSVREIAILVTGTRFHARYELYAHERVAAGAGLGKAHIAAITAGQRPPDLPLPESLAYDVASILSGGGHLGETTYQTAIDTFGDQGTAELIYLVGYYCFTAVMLNGFDMPLPE